MTDTAQMLRDADCVDGRVDGRVDGLDGLLVALLAAGGPDRVTLTDNGALHRLLAATVADREVRPWLPRLGYRPDPLLTHRVVGLDDAVLTLAADGRLLRREDGWVLSPTGRDAGRGWLHRMDPAGGRALRALARAWRRSAAAEAARRARTGALQVAQRRT